MEYSSSKSTFDAINAHAKSIRQILDTNKYEIDVFQREYMWQRKQIEDLIDDLSTKFLSQYNPLHERKEVQNYASYYMGSIILSQKEGRRSIIDGQQRLTSITLLVIYLKNLQSTSNKNNMVNIDYLIFSEKYGEKTYNIQVEDRMECINALYNNEDYDYIAKGDSAKNIVERYNDIEEIFSTGLKDKVLPFFIDWLIENVIFVEINTSSDEDAYLIFETMNDRGLNLTSTDMLKGYLLSHIDTQERKNTCFLNSRRVYRFAT